VESKSVSETVSRLVARTVRVPAAEVSPSDEFESFAGWSSVTALRLLVSLEETLGVTLDVSEYFAIQTVGELIGTLEARQANA